MQNSPRVAIVCDWLIGGGAERVVYELHLLYPEAPIYTSYCSDFWRKELAPAKVVTGYLQYWPFSKLRKFLPILRQWWFSSLKFNEFDIVISASGAEAKGINVPQGVKHISYIHAPTHYYWARYDQYLKQPGFGPFNWLARFGLKKLIGPMREWDYRAAQKPDVLIANSNHTAEQIKRYYLRDSEVIHPPVRTKKFNKYAKPKSARDGFIIVSRQTPYKKVGLAVKACSDLELKLKVVGQGPDNQRLKQMAGPTIEFIDSIYDDSELGELLGSAEGFIFPGFEDFGIAPVEALAAGTPVIAFGQAGALDFINPGKNGELFEKQTITSLRKALQDFNPSKYAAQEIKRSAEPFSIDAFRSKIAQLVNSF